MIFILNRPSAKLIRQPLIATVVQKMTMIQNNHREVWDIYNAEGVFQNRTVFRGDKLNEGDFHLVVHIWIRNKNGDYLIQKRSSQLDLLPGIWAATGGSVVSGESKKDGAKRELREELRLDANNLSFLFEIKRKDNLSSVWLLEKDVSNEEIRCQAEEVDKVSWVSPEQIYNMVSNGVFFNYGRDYFSKVFSTTIDYRAQRMY